MFNKIKAINYKLERIVISLGLIGDALAMFQESLDKANAHLETIALNTIPATPKAYPNRQHGGKATKKVLKDGAQGNL